MVENVNQHDVITIDVVIIISMMLYIIMIIRTKSDLFLSLDVYLLNFF